MSYVDGLKCRECEREYAIEPKYVCEFCFGPLEIVYDYQRLSTEVTREAFAAGPPTLWRYRSLLPVESATPVDLGAGYTPLLRAENLGRKLGIDELYIKNDAVNPSYSFKDRVVTVAVTKALEFGFDTVACASTGNLAAAVAAHAAKGGLPCYIFIPADLEHGKVVGTAIYGPNLIAVDGNYDEVNRLCSEVADEFGWAFVNINLRPFYSEGSKTLAFETAEQLDWEIPDQVVVPMAGGSVLTKIHKGFHELAKLGFIDDPSCRVFGAQAEGCAPVVRAFRKGLDVIEPVKPDTIAKSLAIGNPADGYYALKAIRASGGRAAAVTDAEIVEGMQLLAETEGIFTETAGGVTVAVAKQLAAQGHLEPDARTVLYITGNGLKTMEYIEDAVAAASWKMIKPRLAEFSASFAAREEKKKAAGHAP